MADDPYRILGVDRRAPNLEEIYTKAYKKASLAYHPDKVAKDPVSQKNAQEAFCRLTD